MDLVDCPPSPKKSVRAASAAKSRIVPVRFAPSDFVKLETVAAKNSVSVSELVRQSVLRGSGVAEAVGVTPRGLLGSDERLLFGALLDEVRRVGVNINQIAMRMNAGRVSGAEEISPELEELRTLLGGLSLELRQLSIEPLSTVRGADA